MKSFSRRKFIAISAAAAGMELIPFGTKPTAANLLEWSGLSLGSVATIRIHHPDPVAGRTLLKQVAFEAKRLESIFSLYQTDSALTELNRRGVLVAPPAELANLLGLCDRFWHLTGGAFDPTVQPLWECYAAHFSTDGRGTAGPEPAVIEKALRLVGWRNVLFDRDRIVFKHPGMGLTLNGVAQGYITDCVIGRLREAGLESCLVDMGEIRTLGHQPDGRPWRVGLRGPGGDAQYPGIDAVNNAVATSGAEGFQFDEVGRCNHLFDPATGLCADPVRSLTVATDTAAAADALSTAFAIMDRKAIAAVLSRAFAARPKVYETTIQGTREIKVEPGSQPAPGSAEGAD